MTAPTVIRNRREKDLASFREALAGLEGVTDEHLDAMWRAGTTQGVTGRNTPKADDALGNAGFNAATFNAMAQVLATQQARIEKLEAQKATKTSQKSK